VSIAVQPSDTLEFVSSVEWPDGTNYDQIVFDGILDALMGWGYKLITARFELREIGWHSVNSAPIAYYNAAKRAVRSLLTETGERFDD
jgi:hypothetical protein